MKKEDYLAKQEAFDASPDDITSPARCEALGRLRAHPSFRGIPESRGSKSDVNLDSRFEVAAGPSGGDPDTTVSTAACKVSEDDNICMIVSPPPALQLGLGWRLV